ISALEEGELAPEFGPGSTSFGPELGFGHVMGWYDDEPVLLVKASIGNRSLSWDCLPPGSSRYDYNGNSYAGYGDSPNNWPINGNAEDDMRPTGWADGVSYPDNCQLHHNGVTDISSSAHTSDPASEPGVGAQWTTYRAVYSVFNVTDILDNFSGEFPQLAAQGFEIAGCVWWQGHKDQNEPHAGRYESNLVNFIQQIQAYYENRYPTNIQGAASVNFTPDAESTDGGNPVETVDVTTNSTLFTHSRLYIRVEAD
ncbi:MAG: hypothetical protein AAF492_32215, partial [Verrucomicrobiota bacterium]